MAKQITDAKFKKIMASLKGVSTDFELDGMDFTDDVAFEVARSTLDEHPGLKEYIVAKVGARDYEGWLANQF
jgi:hypothetical protein